MIPRWDDYKLCWSPGVFLLTCLALLVLGCHSYSTEQLEVELVLRPSSFCKDCKQVMKVSNSKQLLKCVSYWSWEMRRHWEGFLLRVSFQL